MYDFFSGTSLNYSDTLMGQITRWTLVPTSMALTRFSTTEAGLLQKAITAAEILETRIECTKDKLPGGDVLPNDLYVCMLELVRRVQ